MSKPSMVIPARALAFVAPFRAVHDIRFYLCGFAVDPHPEGGVVVSATNGHQLAVAYCKNGYTDRRRIMVVTPRLAAEAKKTKAAMVGLKNERLTVIQNPPGIELDEWCEAPGLEAYIQSGEQEVVGNFVDVARVLPKMEDLEPGLRGYVAARYLKQIGEAALFLGGPKYSGCEHWTSTKGGAVLTRFPTAPTYMLVTMPMRGEVVEESPIPDFVAAMRAESDERQRKKDAADLAEAQAKEQALAQLKATKEGQAA